MLLIALLVACVSESPAPEPASAQTPHQEQAFDEPPPTGRIGGSPILPQPVVLGAISIDAVEAGLSPLRRAIDRCWSDELAGNPGLAGKVLVRFTIGADGKVSAAATRSTSLRHPPTEQCVLAALTSARFVPLESGRTAIVTYPFVFPPS